MFINRFLTLPAILVVFTLNVFAQDPVDINDRLVAIQDTMFQHERAWQKQFKELDKGTMQFAELKAQREVWSNYIVKRMAEVKGMKDTGGSIKFRGAVYTLLMYKKQFIDNAIAPIEKLNSHATIPQMKPYRDKLIEGSKKENEFIDKVLAEQKLFTSRNHIVINMEVPEKD